MEEVRTRKVELSSDAFAQGKVLVDGVDLSKNVSRVTIDVVAGGDNRGTKVYLEMNRQTVSAEVEALVLDRTQAPDEVLQFLRSVDPQILEADSLQLLGVRTDSPAEAFLITLQAMAQEATDDDDDGT